MKSEEDIKLMGRGRKASATEGFAIMELSARVLGDKWHEI